MKSRYLNLCLFLLLQPIGLIAQTVINGGTTTIVTSQTITDLSLISGNLVISDGVTLTVTGTFEYFSVGNIDLNNTGKIVFGPAAVLKYSGSTPAVASAKELPVNGGPATIICSNAAGVSLQTNYTITGRLQLESGIFEIAAGITLTLNGAALQSSGGFLAGNSILNATSNLTIQGLTGGVVTLPVNGTIGLRNLTIADTRIVALDGVNNLAIAGTLSIGTAAVFDNGGESQITSGGLGAAVDVSGKFINRDKDNFTGTNGVIPSITVTLRPDCTVEYGLATGGNQVVSKRTDYRNIRFSGNGIKSITGTFAPFGTVSITNNAIVNAANFTFGDSTTNLTMDGGRLKLTGTNNPQPHMAGNYALTGGVVEFACTTFSGQTIRSETYKNIEVSGLYVANSNGNITLIDQGNFIIKSKAKFEINDDGIVGPIGTQTVTVETGGIFSCGDKDGFSGKSGVNATSVNQNIENILLNVGSTVEYSRSNNQVITSNEPYYHLTIKGTLGTKIAGGGITTILGNFTKTGASKFDPGNGTLLFGNANAEQYISYTGATTMQFFNLTNNNSFGNGLSLLNDLQIINAVTLAQNSRLNLNNSDIILLSTANSTARVSAVPSSASINYGAGGMFAVERFFPNNNPATHRAWRLVTAPVNATESIFNNWQLGGAAYAADNYHRGVLITGPQLPGNGLDYTPTNNYSLRKFNGIDLNTVPVENTNIPLSPSIGTGYLLFVRGDRNPILTNPLNSDYTTISSKGQLQTGSVTIPVASNFMLVGNPYASPIDFNAIDKSNNINPHRFWVWDPNLNLVGGYVVMEDGPLSPGIFAPVAPNLTSAQNNMIQSSQAFFVERINNAPASITFSEDSKTGNNNQLVFRPITDDGKQFVRTNLYQRNSDSTTVMADGNLVEFNNLFSAAVDINDAIKLTNINEGIALQKYAYTLAIDRRPEITGADTLFYQITNTTPRAYQLQLNTRINTAGITGYWQDAYTGLSTPVNLQGLNHLNFEVTTDTASSNPNRFRLVFKNSGILLPFTFVTINAGYQNRLTEIKWIVNHDEQILKYQIQQSTDGVYFTTVGTIDASLSFNKSYRYQIPQVLVGKFYYRIKAINVSEEQSFSQTINLCNNCIEKEITIYPNPVVQDKIDVLLTNQPSGLYQLKVIDNNGECLLTQSFNHIAGSSKQTIYLNKSILSTGYYQFIVTTPDKMVKVFSLLVRKQ